MRIDRCMCRNITFQEMKRIARDHNIRDLESLQKMLNFGDNCHLCHPYVREMLVSGKVVFTEILEDPE